MTFEQAWNERIEELGEDKKKDVQLRIEFGDIFVEAETATMVTKTYHRDIEKTKRALRRAWETYCEGTEGIEDSIGCIRVSEAEDFANGFSHSRGRKLA
jgi:hypothetical protein